MQKKKNKVCFKLRATMKTRFSSEMHLDKLAACVDVTLSVLILFSRHGTSHFAIFHMFPQSYQLNVKDNKKKSTVCKNKSTRKKRKKMVAEHGAMLLQLANAMNINSQDIN